MDIYTYGEEYYNYLKLENEIDYIISLMFINFVKKVFIKI